VFFRLLGLEDKATALANVVPEARLGGSNSSVLYSVPPSGFRQIPSSPFAYWLSPAIRHKFSELPPFVSEDRLVRVGLQSSDDFRFVRTWWEVAPSRILDAANCPSSDTEALQDWCRRRTNEGKRWAPFAKGGEYSPFHSDLSMVVNWEREGREIYEFNEIPIGSAGAPVRNPKFYFRPGVTWPLRGTRLSTQAVPAGAIFSIADKMAFSERESELLPLLAITNSRPFDYFAFAGKVGGVQYEVGLISRVPVPATMDSAELERHAADAVRARLVAEQANERSHLFARPSLLWVEGASIAERYAAWSSVLSLAERDVANAQAAVDESALALYGISDDDRASMSRWFAEISRSPQPPEKESGEDRAVPDEAPAPANASRATADLLSYGVGCIFGRWDVRVGCDPSLAINPAQPFDPLPVCSPGMLTGLDELPARMDGIVDEDWLRARPSAITLPADGSVQRGTIPDIDYPVKLARDGILVDDPEHSRDVVGRLQSLLELIWGERAEVVEQEACEILGVKSLRDYFGNPRGFFDNHIKRYSKSTRKAPIYWLLQSSRRSYGLWLYYQRLDADLLFKALTNYVDPKVQRELGRLADLRSQMAQSGSTGSAARQAERAIERQQAFIAELHDFRERLNRAASLGLKPDLDDGAVLNAAPLWELMPWKVAKDYWQELLKGEYAWSSIGKQLRAKKLVAAR
jgi:hypothetical protein